MVSITALEKGKRKIKFVVEGINAQFANALRRIMLTEIPVLAVDTVSFSINDSALYDEIIAHRLGLVLLWYDPKAFNLKESCNCDGKGCSNCQIIFAIDKKGPVIVYTKDMKSADSKTAKPLFDKMPIAELFEGQRLKAVCTAELGFGKDHAKFSAAKPFYRNYPSISVSGLKNPEACINICPKKALSIQGNKASVSENCDMCKECVKIADPRGSIKIEPIEEKYIFEVESISGLDANYIVLQALDILKKKSKEFEKLVKELK